MGDCRSIRTVLMLACLVLAGSAPPLQAGEDRKGNACDAVVDQFILYDIGRLPGAEGQRAYRAFQALGTDEAIPALVRGVNKSARMQQSCPIVVIAGKLRGMLQSTSDRSMLEYAIRNLDGSGSGVFYGNYVESLRELAQRKLYGEEKTVRELRGGTVSQLLRSKRPVEQWSHEDLQEAVRQEKDTQLVRVLEELMQRQGGEYTNTLAEAIAVVPEDAKELARGLLAQRLTRMTDRTLIAKLEDPDVEVRAAAVRAIGYKGSPLYRQLAAALRDEPMVADYAHQVLVKLSGEDFGPAPGSPAMEWYRASKRWEEWADRQPPAQDPSSP